MSTGQTMLTIGAFILLSNILVTFYRLLAESGQTIDSAQSGITAVSLATSYTQIAQGLVFDENTYERSITQLDNLTPPARLGRDLFYGVDTACQRTGVCDSETTMSYFDDIDDLNGFSIRDTTLGGTLGYYRAGFKVYYVYPSNIDSASNTKQTFVKRLDVKIWRESPPSTDTVQMSMIRAYWHFTL